MSRARAAKRQQRIKSGVQYDPKPGDRYIFGVDLASEENTVVGVVVSQENEIVHVAVHSDPEDPKTIKLHLRSAAWWRKFRKAKERSKRNQPPKKKPCIACGTLTRYRTLGGTPVCSEDCVGG